MAQTKAQSEVMHRYIQQIADTTTQLSGAKPILDPSNVSDGDDFGLDRDNAFFSNDDEAPLSIQQLREECTWVQHT